MPQTIHGNDNTAISDVSLQMIIAESRAPKGSDGGKSG